MVKNIYGTNIENTTYGANSPITVNIEEIETVFKSFQKEIEGHPDLKPEAKKEVSQVVKELKTEITKTKDQKKVKGLLEKLKGSAN